MSANLLAPTLPQLLTAEYVSAPPGDNRRVASPLHQDPSMMKQAISTESFSSLSSEQLTGVTGGRAARPIFEQGGVVGPLGSATPRAPIFEQGGVVGPLGSATPRPTIFEHGGVVGPLGSPTPGHVRQPIPERGGIVGPKGSPTPF